MHLYGAAAMILAENDVMFEDAYELLFKRKPRKLLADIIAP